MARSHEGDRHFLWARRTLPALLGAVLVGTCSLVAAGSSSATTNQGDTTTTTTTGTTGTTTGTVVVECRSDVVTEGDVSMSAMSVTRYDVAPTDLPEGCSVVS